MNSNAKLHIAYLAVVLTLLVIIFLNAIRGEQIFDDAKQYKENEYKIPEVLIGMNVYRVSFWRAQDFFKLVSWPNMPAKDEIQIAMIHYRNANNGGFSLKSRRDIFSYESQGKNIEFEILAEMKEKASPESMKTEGVCMIVGFWVENSFFVNYYDLPTECLPNQEQSHENIGDEEKEKEFAIFKDELPVAYEIYEQNKILLTAEAPHTQNISYSDQEVPGLARVR